MESTSQSDSTTPAPNAGAPLVEYVRTNRQNTGYVLVAVSVAILALTAFLAFRAYRMPATAENPVNKPSVSDPFDPEKPPELPKKVDESVNLKRGDYTVGWVGTMLLFLITGSAGMWLLSVPGSTVVEKQRSESRILILALAGLIGGLLILFGIWYFYRWSESLVNWLDKGESKEARWVLIPILMTVLGAGIVFLGIQPARAEERNNSTVRRLVYGSNFGLTVLLLLVALVVANVLFAVRVPNKLDTTETGFYSISDNTTELLRRLDPSVTAYAILPDSAGDRLVGDIRQFLLGAQDASEGKFKVQFVSPVLDKKELNTLTSKYPQLDLMLAQRSSGGAVVLTAGADEKRHKVIPVRDFFLQSGNGPPAFNGEVHLFRELTLLADNQVKPIIYFTQSNGELTIRPEDQAPDNQKGARFRAYLEKNYLEVRPLTLARENPTIPDDAAVVVIAGPRVAFQEPAVAALRKYVNTPRASDGKKGKLIVLAGVVPGIGGKGVMRTGLEGLLGELNIGLGEKYVYTPPVPQSPNPLEVLVAFARAALVQRHPVAIEIARARGVLPMPNAREVSPSTTTPSLQATPLLETVTFTWLEDDRVSNVRDILTQLSKNDQVRSAKNLTESGRPMGVTVSEGTATRAAVFGCADFISDDFAREYSPESAPLTFDLVGVTIDWLRERPSVAAVGIEAKKYREYSFPEPAAVDTGRLLYLPLTLGILVVVGLGAGVWVVRRK